MARKYDMRICKCGRIHMVDNNKLNKVLENNKNLLIICGGCGHATLIGADIVPNWDEPNKNSYVMHSDDFSPYKDKSIISIDFESTYEYKGIEEILYSHGIKVPMMTGEYATDFYNGIFFDRWYPDFYKIQGKDVTIKEVMDFIDECRYDRKTVNMSRFINETPDDVLEEISHYMIDGFNWKGTKWETEWNSR